jgi:hypothetical protein
MSLNYNDLLNKSYFTDINSSGRYAPLSLSRNMIPCGNINEFHYQTSFFLNLYTSLLIELKNYEKLINYNIATFTEKINNLKIKFSSSDYTNDSPSSTQTNKLSTYGDSLFTFYYKTFESIGNNDSLYTTSSIYTTSYDAEITKYKPKFSSTTLTTGFINNLINRQSSSGNILDIEFNKNNIDNYYFNSKLKEIIKQILNQKPENIIGFILYQKIFYNIILYNIDIQISIRNNYINNTTNLDIGTSNLITLSSTINDFSSLNSFTIVKDLIESHIGNLSTISTTTFGSNDYLLEKNQYKDKINAFNVLREEYAKTQDKLNMSIKLYNYELTNYNKIKNYATYVIITLIIIILLTIILSIFPIFKNDTKNAIYIITFIILLIITYLYYTNFKYVILYEKYENLTSDCTRTINLPNTNTGRLNHANYYNKLLPYINRYTNAVDNLFNDLRMNIYTIGSKSFSQDANTIIYNVYLEKKRQLEMNNIKLTNLFNMIEIIKKQISYLFNFVFVIACLCLILLLGLVLYSSVPQLFVFIIILCVILITILMIYFAFAIIQPTRMIANKNYWAIVNPTKKTYGKL